MEVAEINNLTYDKGILLNEMGVIYQKARKYTKALQIFKESKVLFDSINSAEEVALELNNIGETFLLSGQIDSALYYCSLADKKATRLKSWVRYLAWLNLGKIQAKKQDYVLALSYFRRVLGYNDTTTGNYSNNLASMASV